MRARILGSAAGGGFPQWNCGCHNCAGLRARTVLAEARTQTSVAVSADGHVWFLLSASPEVRVQIERFPALHPVSARRATPIAGVALVNGDLDGSLGLLCMREDQPITVYATEKVRRGFTEDNVLYRTLARFPGQCTWRAMPLSCEVPLLGVDGAPSGLTVEAVAAAGKVPVHLEGRIEPSAEDNVALWIRDAARGRSLVYAPSVGGPSAPLLRALGESDCVMFDGTFWSEDELQLMGLGTRRARDMAHWPLSGDDGSLSVLAALPAPHKVLLHINNTNPILRDDSHERHAVARAGIEIARDGMEVIL